MSEKSIYLFCTEGGSDKEYHAHLRAMGNGWIVQYANGPRGRVGQSKNKFEAPTTLEAATKVYNDLVKSKMKGGYTEAESGVRFTNTEHAARASGHAQQLPTSISEQQAQALDRDDDWCSQEKANGERRTVEVKGSEVRGINKLGLYVNIPETWVAEFRAFGDVTFDGEHVGDTLHVFDLLVNDGKDIKGQPFSRRYAVLEKLVEGMNNVSPSIKILKASFTTEDKRALVQEIKDGNREGMVYKNVRAPYDSGRSDDALKFKLVESSSCM
jgi:bifunctional non-homologous end joining protein LigD